MGYTHYYEQKRSFTDAEWSIIVKGWRLISKEAKHYLDDKSNLDSAHAKHKLVDPYFDINGIGDEAHENFVLYKKLETQYRDNFGVARDNNFNFVKTNRKKYDRYVVALLILINNVAPNAFQVRSDGYLDEWFDGMDILKNYVQSVKVGPKVRHFFDFQFPDSLDSRGIVRVERPAANKDGFAEILDVNLPKLKDHVNRDFDFKPGDKIVYGSGKVYQMEMVA